MLTTRLDAPLRVPNRFEDDAGLLEVLRVAVLLLADLAQQDAELVAEVGHGVIACLLAPVGQLAGDGGALAARVFMGGNGVGLGFDELEELLGEVGLRRAAEAVGRGVSRLAVDGRVRVAGSGKGRVPVESEAVLRGAFTGAAFRALLLGGANGEGAVPDGDEHVVRRLSFHADFVHG